VLAGGGIEGGQAYGKTSNDGETVEEGKVDVGDLLATLSRAVAEMRIESVCVVLAAGDVIDAVGGSVSGVVGTSSQAVTKNDAARADRQSRVSLVIRVSRLSTQWVIGRTASTG